MFRPVSLKGGDECKLVLYRNRREELADIPTEYISDITHNVNTYSSMSFSIPSKISYSGKIVPYQLYEDIKGKMFIICDINGQKQKFMIDDDIVTSEDKEMKKKNGKAYSYEKTLEKKSFIISEGLTRQLYRTPDEDVEIGEGILNLFEQQTNWKVGYVDFDARKDLGLYMVNEEVLLFETFDKEKVVVDEVVWSKANINISVGEKPLNITITYPNMESYLEGKLQKKENVTHTFNNLPYGVKHIWAKYTSDEEYRFGMTYTFEYSDGSRQTFKRAFANVKDMRILVNNMRLTYETGEYQEQYVTKYRYFEQGSTFWYQFLMNDVAKAYDCVVMFDSYNQTVNIYAKKNFGEYKGLNLNYDNAIKTLNKTHKVGEVITQLYVESPNCSISSENPLGGDFIECFDYYINHGIMSDILIEKLTRYNRLVEEKQIEFLELKLEKNTIDQRKSKKESELKALQERLKAENALLTAYIKAEDSQKQKEQSLIVSDIEKSIEECLKAIQEYKDLSQALQDRITDIGNAINKNNATDIEGKIFDNDDMEELADYIVEGKLTNEYYTLPYGLYQHAVSELKKMNEVYIEFSIDAFNFLSKLKHPNGWQYLLQLGDKVELDDTDIQDEQGFIQLYGYTYYPSDNKVGALKFTNNKEPISAIKSIGDVGRKVNSQVTMTNFWKDTWKDSQVNNVAVKDIIENGLDVASQIVRGRGVTNKIDISESGIYIIDSQDENKQMYLGSGLISLTEDKWQTSKLAIDSSGVIADTLVGKLLLGEKLQIGNEDNTVTILPDGIRIYDSKSSREERIFIGVENVNGRKVARLRLHSANDSSKLVLSEEGIYQMVSFSGRDNLDIYSPFRMSFYIPSNFQRLDEARVRLRTQHFRTYSKGATASAQSVASATVDTHNGYGKTSTANGGGTYASATTTSTQTGQIVETNQIQSVDGRMHKHTIVIPNRNHNHNVTVNIGNHTHSFDINAHGHNSRVTIPSHGHELIHGIFEYSKTAKLKLFVDDILVMEDIGGDRDVDILPFLKYSAGWHNVRVESVSQSDNTQGLRRVEIEGMIGGFCSF